MTDFKSFVAKSKLSKEGVDFKSTYLFSSATTAVRLPAAVEAALLAECKKEDHEAHWEGDHIRLTVRDDVYFLIRVSNECKSHVSVQPVFDGRSDGKGALILNGCEAKKVLRFMLSISDIFVTIRSSKGTTEIAATKAMQAAEAFSKQSDF